MRSLGSLLSLLLLLFLVPLGGSAKEDADSGSFSSFSSSSSFTIVATPWCANSFRVQIQPASTAHAREELRTRLASEGLQDLPAGLIDECGPGAPVSLGPVPGSDRAINGNLAVTLGEDGLTLSFSAVDSGKPYCSAVPAFSSANSSAPGFLVATLDVAAGDPTERLFGLGQGGWTGEGSCPSGTQEMVPVQRNGQSVNLQHRKFHVGIPWLYSTTGYGFLWHMVGYAGVSVGELGVGGARWNATAALEIDIWVTGLPAGTTGPAPIFSQYADATGHAPRIRDDALLFWQSRNRYKSSAIALSIADRYQSLSAPVGVLVVDYKNMVYDGDFAPNPACYPSLSDLVGGVRARLNATTMFSFWPEVLPESPNFALFNASGCLSNSDLDGRLFDGTVTSCRALLQGSYLMPNYINEGVTAFWLDETDGNGEHGYDTSFGPAAAYSQLWITSWLRTFSEPIVRIGVEPPLLLTRGAWAGSARFGAVLWSSDIWSTFEELAAMVPQGVHASLSGIPWWTTDAGGYGCHNVQPNNSSYMQELIVRWMQFAAFCPVFRMHGCRDGGDPDPDVPPCTGVQPSCGPSEIWAYGAEAQDLLAGLLSFRVVLRPYLSALSANVSTFGTPTMRPLWYEFPNDPSAWDVDSQYLLGPDLLVAPVVVQGATNRTVVFPAGASWVSVWNATQIQPGGTTVLVDAPLDVIPAYWRA